MKKSWVSFCMSTYKRPVFLRQTLESIRNQSFSDFEVIVSDNDPDNSAEPVVRSVGDPRIKYFSNGGNLGMIGSFNKSIERASSDHVVMITDDDPIYPQMLQTLFDLANKFPGYGVYHGACDVIYETEEMAEACRGKIGINSCLADLPVGYIRKYTAEQFPLAFFTKEVSNYLLWSTCVVKKKILIEIGGIPDYGTPFMGDLAFTVLTCSQEGGVFTKSSLGAQVVHGKNFGYIQDDNYAGYYRTANGFHDWISARLSNREDWPLIRPQMEKFIGRWMVGYGLSLRKHLKKNNQSVNGLNVVLNRIFEISYLRKWKWKFYIGAYFPRLFEALIKIKGYLFEKSPNKPN